MNSLQYFQELIDILALFKDGNEGVANTTPTIVFYSGSHGGMGKMYYFQFVIHVVAYWLAFKKIKPAE